MKKVFKKIMVLVLLFTLIFTFTVKPKKADAFIGEMTLAGIAATVGASAMLPYALGAAGILAVGGVIKNWDVVKEYGEEVIAKMGGYDAASGSYVQNPDGTATVIYSPAMKLAMAQAVDDVPPTVTAGGVVYNVGSFTIANTSMKLGVNKVVIDTGSLVAGDKLIIKYTKTGLHASSTQLVAPAGAVWSSSQGSADGAYSVEVLMNSNMFQYFTGTVTVDFKMASSGASDFLDYSNVSIAVQKGVPGTISTSDTFGTVADNVNARLLGMNAAISDNQAVTISADAELLNASIDDLASISNATLTETQTQTGILSQIWNNLKNLPGTIVAASAAAAASINANMDQLWDDAGAIWSGMADTITNLKTDFNAKMAEMQTAMAGGIDNVRTDIGTMMENLRAGIDSMAASAAANMASWGQLTLDGIDAGIGAITSGLSTVWTNTTTAIDTAATATTTAITNLTDKLTTGMDQITTWITDFPAMMMSIVIPPAAEFSMAEKIAEIAELLEQKFGSMDELMTTIRGAFDQTGSIYEIEISLMGRQYKIVPIMLKPTIDGARPFLTAAVNLTSLTFLIHRNKKELFK